MATLEIWGSTFGVVDFPGTAPGDVPDCVSWRCSYSERQVKRAAVSMKVSRTRRGVMLSNRWEKKTQAPKTIDRVRQVGKPEKIQVQFWTSGRDRKLRGYTCSTAQLCANVCFQRPTSRINIKMKNIIENLKKL